MIYSRLEKLGVQKYSVTRLVDIVRVFTAFFPIQLSQ